MLALPVLKKGEKTCILWRFASLLKLLTLAHVCFLHCFLRRKYKTVYVLIFLFLKRRLHHLRTNVRSNSSASKVKDGRLSSRLPCALLDVKTNMDGRALIENTFCANADRDSKQIRSLVGPSVVLNVHRQRACTSVQAEISSRIQWPAGSCSKQKLQLGLQRKPPLAHPACPAQQTVLG